MFQLVSSYKPMGDQPQAIRQLVDGVNAGAPAQVLLGVTGSGKTFTMANVIAQTNKPTLILSHNKTLAAQLYTEMKSFFPNNAVEYFVSYYDYYQPEAYIASSDTYIEKTTAVNEEIDRLRHSATCALAEGFGEELTPLKPARLWCLLAKPPLSVSTAEAYKGLDALGEYPHPDTESMLQGLRTGNLQSLRRGMDNVLEQYTLKTWHQVAALKEQMRRYNPDMTMMSGSGPTVFGLFENENDAQKAMNDLRDSQLARQTYLTEWFIPGFGRKERDDTRFKIADE